MAVGVAQKTARDSMNSWGSDFVQRPRSELRHTVLVQENPGRLPLEMLVGVHPPSHWVHIENLGEEHRLVAEARRWGREWARPAVASDSIDWSSLGVVPRFVGSESTACVAAMQPGCFHGGGADEFDRFLSAAARRDETALIVSTIGEPEAPTVTSVFGRGDASILLPGGLGTIAGRRLPDGVVPELAEGLSAADRDLALRLQDAAHAWWAIKLADTVSEGVSGREIHSPGGVLQPLLVNALGEVLAGVWVPAGGRDWRWYIVPDGTDWNILVAWAAERAAPEFVPGALHRARSVGLIDAELMTPAELTTLGALKAFEDQTALTRARLEGEVKAATDAASEARHDLLYGTGEALSNAVAVVLRSAGLHVEDLDMTFGGGRSSDLLVTSGGVNCLVEVKSASGRPSESMLDSLERHKRTWASLGRTEELHRSALVVNHQHNLAPLSRTERAYEREEFLDSLHHVVVPSLTLYCWWRDASDSAVAEAFISGPIRQYATDVQRESTDVEGRSSRPTERRAERVDSTPPKRKRWRRAD